MNHNTKRKVECARDAFGRCKQGRAQAKDPALAESIGHKLRKSRKPKVGASGKDIARRLGHDRNSEAQAPR